MKYKLLFVYFLLFWFSLHGNSQDTIQQNSPEKKGWNIGVLPAVSYNSDLGFQYGGLVNLFHYGDGSRYPRYNHTYYFELSKYTKGSALIRLAYDSDQLIKNIRTTFDFSYMPEQAIDFYGFNGAESVYNESWTDSKSPDYISRVFYKHERNMIRFHADLTGKLSGNNFFWLAGAEFYDISVNSVNVDKLNRGKDEDDKLPDPKTTKGLYEKYIDWKLISEEDQNGGLFAALKFGLVFDSRDFQPNPMRGIWTDVILYAAPKATSSLNEGFLRLSITHRQYFTLVREKLSFVYRIGYQGNLGTYVPFYAQPLMITTQLRGSYSEGLGGQRSLRGILRNRVVGDGFAYGNAEFRYKFYRANWFKQNIYLALNLFLDGGQLVKPIDIRDKIEAARLSNPEWTDADWLDYFSGGSERIHYGAGVGLKAVMNENFILSGDYGKALNLQDGRSGLYIGLNFLF
jgi:hypothetical protein